jgi:hypothetical protein
MKSMIHYRFNGTTKYTTILFDGDSLRILDIKRQIVNTRPTRATKATKKALETTDYEIRNEYGLSVNFDDESTLVPKNAHLVVKRVPCEPSLLQRIQNDTPRKMVPPLVVYRVRGPKQV